MHLAIIMAYLSLCFNNRYTASRRLKYFSVMQQLQALGETVRVVSRGAAHNIMDTMRKTTYAQHKPDHGQDPGSEQ